MKAAPVVYIASPIDRTMDGFLPEMACLRDDARMALATVGFVLFDPNAAWAVPTRIRAGVEPLPTAIQTIDLAAVDSVDALLAILPDLPPTIGVPMEIERAIARRIPAVVLGGPAAERSPLLAGRVPVLPMGHYREAAELLLTLVAKRRNVNGDLKVVADGGMPTRSHDDDCGLDLFTYVDPEIGRTQDSLNKYIIHPHYELYFRNPDKVCNVENFHYAAYKIQSGAFVDIDCGVSVEFPTGIWGLITGRSSSIRRKNLLVPNGIIDTGYRGRLYMPVINMGQAQQIVKHGDRIGQLILMNNATLGVKIRPVDFLSPSDRGEKGRGSTGD